MLRKLLPPLAVLGVLCAAAPALAEHARPLRQPWAARNAVRVEFGVFNPRGESDYWNDKAREFTGDADDFQDFSLGVHYLRMVSGRMGVLLSSNFFEGEADQVYIDFVDDLGFDIPHTTFLETASVNLGLLFYLTDPRAAVAPYVGGGAGIYGYRLEESGDFIDFSRPELPIFTDTFVAEGEAFGYYLQAGVEVPVGANWSVLGDFRWQRAEDELGDDFRGFGELDLTGWDARLGFAWRF